MRFVNQADSENAKGSEDCEERWGPQEGVPTALTWLGPSRRRGRKQPPPPSAMVQAAPRVKKGYATMGKVKQRSSDAMLPAAPDATEACVEGPLAPTRREASAAPCGPPVPRECHLEPPPHPRPMTTGGTRSSATPTAVEAPTLSVPADVTPPGREEPAAVTIFWLGCRRFAGLLAPNRERSALAVAQSCPA